MFMLYEDLLSIEKQLEGNEYSDGGISYYVTICKIDSEGEIK